MVFADEIAKPNSPRIVMVRIAPRRRLTDWTVHDAGSNTFSCPWTQANTIAVYNQSNTAMAEATDLADCIATNESWFHDEANGILYANFTAAQNPVTRVVVVEWYIFVATDHLNWFKDPEDEGSEQVEWQAHLIKQPSMTEGDRDLIFGFLPIQQTQIQIQTADGSYYEHLHEWSLNKAQVKVWQCVGELSEDNVRNTFSGSAGNFSLSNGRLSIQMNDPLIFLNDTVDLKTFNQNDFPLLDSDDVGSYVRIVYGTMFNYFPTNIDSDLATPSTTNNREWVVDDGEMSDAATLSSLVDTGHTNTATETKVMDAEGFYGQLSFGDSVVILDNSVAKYAIVEAVDYVTNIITHSSIGARTPVITDTVTRGFVGRATIFRGINFFNLAYGRDWTEVDFANGTRGILLADNFEANHPGLVTFDPNDDILNLRVNGSSTLPKKLDNVTDFGAVSKYNGSNSNPVSVLWDIFRNRIDNLEQVISLDETAWSALALAFDRPIGIAIPDLAADEAPIWRDVIARLLKTELLYLHYDFGAMTISQLGPTGAADYEISEEEFSNPQYDWSYNDCFSGIVLGMNQGEGSIPGFNEISGTNDVATYLNRVQNVGRFESLFWRFDADTAEYDAQNLLDRLLYIFSERRGTLTTNVPIEFFPAKIIDTVEVQSLRLTGFPQSSTINTRPYSVLQHAKTSKGLTIVLDDQKGIEDNSGSW